jgi:C-terminal processing protease CtpA/Prc
MCKGAVRKKNGQEATVAFDVPSPKDKKHPVAHPKPVSFRKLENNIGFLKVTMFPGTVGIDVAHDIDRAIAHLGDCDRLIIDLRGNTGGGIGGLRLMSYLTPGKTPVGYSLTKRRAANGYQKEQLPRFGKIPDSKWMLPLLALRYAFGDKSIAVVTEGLGPKRFHGRVVMLVNQHSASAAEMVAGFASENNLATIVGTKTAGRLLSGSAFKVGHGYVLGLPVAAYLTWQGTLLEGKGITPHQTAELSYDGLRVGLDTQLQTAVAIARTL